MAEFVETANEALPESERRAVFSKLLDVLRNVVENPGDTKHRTVSAGSIPAAGLKILTACGFKEAGGNLVSVGDDGIDTMYECIALMECLVMSIEEEKPANGTKRPAEDSSNMEVDDEDLAEAMRLSMEGAQKPSTDNDAEMAQRIEREESRADVEFQRFNATDVLIGEEAVKEINEYCKATGEPYVDPQFPPADKSLYCDKKDAECWTCFTCRTENPLAPVPDIPKTREEAEKLQAQLDATVCKGCGEKAPNVAKSKIVSRPTQWLRPGVRCVGCEMIYGHMNGGADLITRMCSHYLRDQVANTTVGAPWKLIREAARPEDVCQGAIGNCWFAGALSVVASKPELVTKMFITKEFNPHGAYQIQLFHAGEWKGILIDDLMPTSKIFQGYTDGQMVYYSLGGTLSYLSCARRQLWVPLVEKASAKMFGCYGALNSGTFGEALSLFTGYPCERLEMYIPKEVRKRKAERRDARIAQRTQMLLQGQTPPDDDDDDDDDNDDILWSKLLSYKEAGYLMGMGCTEEGCEKTKKELVEEKGLQAPHAYGVLDVREALVNGKLERLMQIRNPWGENAPRTWQGDFGKNWKGWTTQLKQELGVTNKANVEMYDRMSIFWMRLEDVKEHFAALEVCRVHPKWYDQRATAWLPCGVGAGECFELTVFEKTQVDLALWQEKHITRESAIGGKSTNVDIGVSVLRAKGVNPDGTVEYQCVHYIKRTVQDHTSAEMILDGGYTYKVVPLCFNQTEAYSPRKAVLVAHTSRPCRLSKVSSTWRDVACAVVEGARKFGRRSAQQHYPGVFSYFIQEGCGLTFVIENTSGNPFALQVDCSDSIGCMSARGGGLMAIDSVPARTRQAIMLLSFATGASRTGFSFASEALPAEMASFAVAMEDVHMGIPITDLTLSTSVPPPDPEILNQAAPPDPDPVSPSGEEDPDLAAALALSMGKDEPEEEDDDLAAALAMSMQGYSSEAPKAATSAAAPAPAAAPVAEDAKAKLQSKVKELFVTYTQQGMAPNEAAVKAMQDARSHLGV